MTPGVIFDTFYCAMYVNENGLPDQNVSKMTPGVILVHISGGTRNGLADQNVPKMSCQDIFDTFYRDVCERKWSPRPFSVHSAVMIWLLQTCRLRLLKPLQKPI